MNRPADLALRPVEHSFPRPRRDGPPLIAFDGVSAGYDGAPVLRRVDLDLRRGEFVGIVGPSGSGKTTLLRTLLGQTQRLAGEVREHGGQPGALRVGYVPQVESIDWNFPITVEQVVLLGRWRESGWRPWSSRRDRALARQALERLGIDHLRTRSIRALSGGQQQRVFIARALIGDPDIVLLDEPTTGVDIKTRHDVMHLLGELHRGGLTIVLTTHDLNAVASHLPRLVCIGEGRVVADGTPPQVLTPDVLRDAYGAEMVVLRRGRSVYVVEHDDAPLDPIAAERQHEAFHADPASIPGRTPRV
jgi:zinc/manganese transport system ATP-binding protein/zinc transport system ATP-binding protein